MRWMNVESERAERIEREKEKEREKNTLLTSTCSQAVNLCHRFTCSLRISWRFFVLYFLRYGHRVFFFCASLLVATCICLHIKHSSLIQDTSHTDRWRLQSMCLHGGGKERAADRGARSREGNWRAEWIDYTVPHTGCSPPPRLMHLHLSEQSSSSVACKYLSYSMPHGSTVNQVSSSTSKTVLRHSCRRNSSLPPAAWTFSTAIYNI